MQDQGPLVYFNIFYAITNQTLLPLLSRQEEPSLQGSPSPDLYNGQGYWMGTCEQGKQQVSSRMGSPVQATPDRSIPNGKTLIFQCQLLKQQNQRTSMEIDLSTLSENQKKFYVQLLAQSNLEFTKKDNQFVAQFKVNPHQLHGGSPFMQESKPAPATPKDTQARGKHCGTRKQKEKEEKKRELSKPMSKKMLSRVAKLGELGRFEALHPWVEVYIYPKRMTAWLLQEIVESTYQKFWNDHKKKSHSIRQISFIDWFYRQILCELRDKVRIEQNLVNLLDSIVHFAHKSTAVRVFSGFLGERWSIDVLFYFLVMRGLLEQVTGDRILDKAGGGVQDLRGVTGFKLRSNPQEKMVSEEEVLSFLAILKGEGLFCSKGKTKSFDSVFQQLTQKMFFDEARRKNFINFYELLEYLIAEYVETEVSSCDMSLSKTEMGAVNEDQSLSELITSQLSHDCGPKSQRKRGEDQNCTYSLALEPTDQEFYREHQQQEEARDLGREFETMVIDRANQMYGGLGCGMSQETLEGLMAGVQAVSRLDKSHWIKYRGGVEQAELLSLQKMQALFRDNEGSTIFLRRLCKQFFLMPAIRQLMVQDIAL